MPHPRREAAPAGPRITPDQLAWLNDCPDNTLEDYPGPGWRDDPADPDAVFVTADTLPEARAWLAGFEAGRRLVAAR